MQDSSESKVPTQAPAIDVVAMQAAARPYKLALICGEHSLTYAALNARANRVANVLRKLGVDTRDRVAIMAHNSLESVEVGAATTKVSAILVPINYRLREHEVAYVINDSEAKVVFAGPELVQVIEQARAEVQGQPAYIAIGGQVPAGWLHYEKLLQDASEELQAGERSLGSTMSYTSGTTGKPKGAYRPQGTSLQAILQTIQSFELADSDVHLLAGPVYHSAPHAFVSLNILLGATIVAMPRFDAVEALRLIDRYGVTTTFMAPTLLQLVCDVPDEIAKAFDTSSLRAIILGAAPCPYALKVRAIERFGPCLWEFYGATETGFVTILRPEDQLRKPGSSGTVAPGQEIRLLNESGEPVSDGVPGEIWVRNPSLAQYFKKPDATARSMRDSFFSVGDIAYRDSEGYYYICDRKIDMIISAGANIYPAEIEAVLSAHPAVADVAVIGVPDAHWGESVKAVVSLRPAVSASEKELIAYCAGRLADYKKPRSVDFVDELPRNPAGKLLKRKIREVYWQDRDRKI
ncbi:MAG TPA: AMP-binding protein [Ktedonobacteraceae bacterium]|nr:AMP-binding protein [Ktedonobacteraceae bacterium]